jgi:hypothetical protein
MACLLGYYAQAHILADRRMMDSTFAYWKWFL